MSFEEKKEIKRRVSSTQFQCDEASQKRLEKRRKRQALSRELQDDEAKHSRQEKNRKRKALSRELEDDEAKQIRLEKTRKRQVLKRVLEDDEAKEIRRRKNREQMALRRANKAKSQEKEISQQAFSKQQYLHQNGWSNNLLHHQAWVQREMTSFHEYQRSLHHKQCSVCCEAWPTTVKQQRSEQLVDNERVYVCARCQRDKKSPRLFSAGNDMHPGPVPEELVGLTDVEEMLIARACPIMCIFRKHGGQRGYRGHVLNLPQDIQGFLDKLPANVQDLPVLLIRRHGAGKISHFSSSL